MAKDILIIGGSAAGMYAAITAFDRKASVMIVAKALLGRGGHAGQQVNRGGQQREQRLGGGR